MPADSAQAEKALLGSFLEAPVLFKQIDDISAEDFSLDAHRRIYRAMAQLTEDGQPIDQVVLCNLLKNRGELESIRGAAYIPGLIDGCVPERAPFYAEIIRKAAASRRCLNALEIAKSQALDGEAPENILAGLQETFSAAASKESLGHTYEETMNAPEVTFAIDGFLQEQGITLIGGLSGHGKTLIMLAMARALLEGSKLFTRFAVNVPAQKVIYLIPEGGLSPFVKRLRLFGLTDYVRDGRLIYRTLSKKPIPLNHPLLLRAVPGADVFLDTVTRFKAGDENSADENAAFAEDLFNLQRAGARTITGAHHAPKGFGKDTVMTLENILRGTGDIGAMLATCWGVRQIDAERNRIYVQNVKPRDFLPCDPFIIQGRPSIDETGYFDMPEPPGFAGELADHLQKTGRPAIDSDKIAQAHQLKAAGKSYRDIAAALGVSRGTVGNWLSLKETQ